MNGYKIISKLGEGSYGNAFLSLNQNNDSCVLKEIKVSHLSSKDIEEAKKEVKVLSSLIHDQITRFQDSFEANGSLYIVMEYCAGGNLQSLISNRSGIYFPERRILDWFIQLSLAVRFVHQRHIIHRDIKTQNVFLTVDGRIKLGDFGIAKILDKTSDLANTCIGTPYYLPPEMCENKPYSNKSDIWSAGCVLYEMACLKHAFDASNMKSLILKIIRCSYAPLPDRYSRDLNNLISEIFQKDPKLRPSMTSILSKPFIMKRLPQYLSITDAEDLKISLSRVKRGAASLKNSTKGSVIRSRLGISEPSSKYNIPVTYKQMPTVCVPAKVVKSKSKVNHNYCHQRKEPSNVHSDSSTNSQSRKSSNPIPYKYSDKRRSGNQHIQKYAKKDLVLPSKRQSILNRRPPDSVSPKFSLIMNEDLSNFENVNVSQSIYVNLKRLDSTISLRDSGSLADLCLSKNKVCHKEDADETDLVLQNDGISEKISPLVTGEVVKACQNAQAKRELAYTNEIITGIHPKRESPPLNGLLCHNLVYINDTTFTPRSFNNGVANKTFRMSKASFCNDLPPHKSDLFQDFSSLTKVNLHSSSSNGLVKLPRSKMDDVSFKQSDVVCRERKRWNFEPKRSIIKIFSSAQITEGTVDAEAFDSSKAMLLEKFNDLDAHSTEKVPKTIEEKRENGINFGTMTENIEKVLMNKIYENDLENDKKLKALTINNEEPSFSYDNEMKYEEDCSSVSDNEMKLNSTCVSADSLPRNKLEDSNSSFDSNLSTSKKKSKRLFSFLRRSSPPQTPAANISYSSDSSSNSLNTSGVKSKSRFSSLLKKVLNRKSKSKTKSCTFNGENVALNSKEILDSFYSTGRSEHSLNAADNSLEESYHNSDSSEWFLQTKQSSKSKEECPLQTTEKDFFIANYLSMKVSCDPWITEEKNHPVVINPNDDYVEHKSGVDSSTGNSKNANHITSHHLCNNEISNILHVSSIDIEVQRNLGKTNTHDTERYSVTTENDTVITSNTTDTLSLLSDNQTYNEILNNANNLPRVTNIKEHPRFNLLICSSQLGSKSGPIESYFISSVLRKGNFFSTLILPPKYLDEIRRKTATSKSFHDLDLDRNYFNCLPQTKSQKTICSSVDHSDEVDGELQPKLSLFIQEEDVKTQKKSLKADSTNFVSLPLVNGNSNEEEIETTEASKSSLSDGESEDVSSFRRSLENLLSCTDDEGMNISNCSSEVFTSELPDIPDTCVYGWIEEQRVFLERQIGLATFMEAYRSLEGIYEGDSFKGDQVLWKVKRNLGPGNEHLVDRIMQLIVTESTY